MQNDPNLENQLMCSSTQSYFDFINYEIFLNIFQYLKISGINNLFLVCKLWACFSNDDHFWKSLFKTNFPQRFIYGKPNQTSWKWFCQANMTNLEKISTFTNEYYIGFQMNGKEMYAGEWRYNIELKSLIKEGNGALYVFDQVLTQNPEENTPIETETLKDVYLGNFLQNRFNAFGIFFWKNGNKYIGDWSSGKQSGKGRFFWSCGENYSGHWENNLREGKGRYTFKDGSFYEGEFKRNKIEGLGKYKWNNGIYEGYWKNNKRDGYGSIEWDDTKNKYDGFFTENMKNGFGIYKWKDGSFFEGNWEKDKRSGKGKTVWSNGMIYIGNYCNDYRNGKGILVWTMKENSFFIGNFRDGARRGNGKLIKGAGLLMEEKTKKII